MLNFKPRNRPFSDAEFKTIYSQTPRLTVDIILKIGSGLVLVERQEESWHGQWHLPGGTVFYREKLANAIRRVGLEELGIAVQPLKLVEPIEYWDELEERGFGFSVSLVYICEAVEPITPELISAWKNQKIEIFDQVPANTVREQIPLIKHQLSESRRSFSQTVLTSA